MGSTTGTGFQRADSLKDLCMGCMEPKGDARECPHCGWFADAPAASILHLPPGTLLGGCYLVGRVLGQGGFGITYIGWDTRLHRKVAIKEYFPQTLASRQSGNTVVVPTSERTREDYTHGLESFLREGRILARFSDHPCIVPVQTLFEENQTGYLVMGFVEGITLSQYLAKEGGKIPYSRALDIMQRVMDGLREVHGQGLLHRDISPDNIYLTKQGTVKILDFGAARFAVQDRSQSLSVVLKPGYAPEEQYRRNGKQGPWTDVYAAAATLYRCVVGATPPDALERLVEDTFKSPRELGIDIPANVDLALRKALAVRAAERLQSIQDLQIALGACAAEAPSATTPIHEERTPDTNRTRVHSPQSAHKNPIRAILETIYAPRKAFTGLNTKTVWILPLFLIGLTAVSVLIDVWRIPIVREDIGFRGIKTRILRFDIPGFLFPFAEMIWTGIIAAVLQGTFFLGFKKKIDFFTNLSVVALSQAPIWISAFLYWTGVAIGRNLPPTNVSHLFRLYDANPVLYHLGLNIDLFHIWSLVVSGIGFGCVYKLRWRASLGVVFVWYVAIITFSATVGVPVGPGLGW